MTTTEKTAATRRIRKSFEQATGLRTYSISWIHAEEGDLFAADAPWAPVHEEGPRARHRHPQHPHDRQVRLTPEVRIRAR